MKEDFNFSKKISGLVEKSFNSYYNPEESIDWNTKTICPEGISTKDYIDSISQLYYAEMFAVDLCIKTSQKVNDLKCREYLLMQALEESRHASMYIKYIEKIGKLLPVNPAMDEIYKQVISWDGHPIATILALNFFIEGEAINQQNKRIKTLPCPLFKEVNQVIVQDEGRHHAFGKFYVKETLPTVDEKSINEILFWIKDLWAKWNNNNGERYQDDKEGIIRNDTAEMNERFMQHLKSLADMGIKLV